MCVAATPPPSNKLTRRGMLAGAAALAGTAAAVTPASADPRGGSAGGRGEDCAPRGGNLVVEGGTVLDPATGEVIEDAVVVIKDGVVGAVGAVGARGSVATPQGVTVLDAHGRWLLPGLVDAHIHLSTAAEARDAVRQGATSARSGSTNLAGGDAAPLLQAVDAPLDRVCREPGTLRCLMRAVLDRRFRPPG